jgi:transmembrane sensor
MEREYLISKWLDNNLNNEELEAFKKLEDYDDLVKLSNNAKAFKAEDFDTSKELDRVLKTIHSTKKQTHWVKPFLKIAAILAICFSLYYYTTTIDTTISTSLAEKTTFELPDASTVSLNAKSFLAYNKNSWKNKRNVELDGEAFFKVAKGSTFNVITKAGTVTVFGTQFNIKQRDNYFEVICYEGVVGVTFNSQLTTLNAGDSFLIIDGKKIAKEKENSPTPSWLNNESQFKSIPFKVVISEFERQYGVTIITNNIDTNQLFTGSFSHKNMSIALQSITLPLHLTYSKNNHTITLKRD